MRSSVALLNRLLQDGKYETKSCLLNQIFDQSCDYSTIDIGKSDYVTEGDRLSRKTDG